MALVAYDNSDSSDYEDEENESTPVEILSKKVESSNDSKSSPLENIKPATDKSGPSLFNLLPSSTRKPAVIEEEDDEFLHKKETAPNIIKPKAKISVPSLNDFRDVEDRPTGRPKSSSGKKSGLLSMLPQPKNASISTTTLVPNVLTKKPSKPLVPDSVKRKTPLPSPMKKAKTDTKSLVNISDDSDNDEDESTDFFSINKPVEIAPIEDVPMDIDVLGKPKNEISEKKPGIESYFKKDPPHVELQPEYMESSDNNSEYYAIDSAQYANGNAEPESSTSSEITLDDEALRQLVGSRAKRRKEDIQIVDVNQQEVLGDAREWMLKSLMDDTTKRVSSSKKSGNEPSAQQRRKHQITYLAHQAKANESELQNQWANNRMSKRKTQSKYGF